MITTPINTLRVKARDILKVDPTIQCAKLEDPWIHEIPGTRKLKSDPRSADGQFHYIFNIVQ